MKLLNTNKKFKPPITINVMISRNNVEVGKPESIQICDRYFSKICEVSMGCIVDPIGIPADKSAGLDEEVDKLIYRKLKISNAE